jgi:hypothetical protein
LRGIADINPGYRLTASCLLAVSCLSAAAGFAYMKALCRADKKIYASFTVKMRACASCTDFAARQYHGQRIAAEGPIGKNVHGDIAPLHRMSPVPKSART